MNQGEGAVAWRQILGEYASAEPGNVLAMWSKLGDLQFPQGSDIVVDINKMEEDMARYQKMAGENLSDTRRIRAAEAHVPQQYTPQKVREDAGRGDVGFDSRAGSARTDGGRSDGDRGRRQERQEGHGQERKRQERPEGSGKGSQAREKAPGPRTPLQIESAFTVTGRTTSKRSAQFVSPTRGTASPRTRKTRERTNGSGKGKRNEWL